MGTRIRRTALSLATAVALCAAATPSALAATWSYADHAGDVVYGSEPDFTEVPAPEDSRDDIVRFQVAHHPRNVVITLTLRDLPRRSHSMHVVIHTPSRRYETWPNGPTTLLVVRTDGPRGGCYVHRETLDSVHLRLRLTIPRSCLGRPRWVRVSAVLMDERWIDGTERVYTDDALRSDTAPHTPGLSPRVLVG